MKHPISTETLQQLQQGSHKAFETVFVSYFPLIKYFIGGYVKSEADAEELAEELFVNLWKNHSQIDATRSFNSFLHTTARNAALNFLKHKYVQTDYENRSPESVQLSYTSEDELIAHETALLIEMTVERMPEQRRNIYRLSRNEGLSNEEIALRLHTTKRNVESQLSLALRDIRKVIYLFLLLVS